MKSSFVVVPLAVLISACASVSPVYEPGQAPRMDAPARFLVLELTTGMPVEPRGPACRSPMMDPRDRTMLTLVRSAAGYGDYRPDRPRYGLAPGQLLRINCSTGLAAGPVPDSP